MYYVISNSDGDTTVEPMTKEELLRRLKGGDWGDCGFQGNTELKNDLDTNYWGPNICIIKGECVSPFEVQPIMKRWQYTCLYENAFRNRCYQCYTYVECRSVAVPSMEAVQHGFWLDWEDNYTEDEEARREWIPPSRLIRVSRELIR